MPKVSRQIVHVDMDCFFASVEILDNPELINLPIIVGGPSHRGVVASCSYIARAYGIRSAMPISEALSLCPTVRVLGVRHDRYREISQKVMSMLDNFSSTVQQVGLDEAYLDISSSWRSSSAILDLAGEIRDKICRETQIMCSVGIGSSKLIAKLASKKAKPRAYMGIVSGSRVPVVQDGPGIVSIPRYMDADFLRQHSIDELPGIGPATLRKLNDLGIRSIDDLNWVPHASLKTRFGENQANRILDLFNGVDDRAVVPNSAPKSISSEETFSQDLAQLSELTKSIDGCSQSVASRLYSSRTCAKTITLKVKTSQFRDIERSRTLDHRTFDAREIAKIAVDLLKPVLPEGPFRLLGVSASNLGESGQNYLQFTFGPFDGPDHVSGRPGPPISDRNDRLVSTLEEIRAKYGARALIRRHESEDPT